MLDNFPGSGGINKDGYGSLTLSGISTYSGPTTNLTGVLTLDFTKPTSPPNNILGFGPNSLLTLGRRQRGRRCRECRATHHDWQSRDGQFPEFQRSAFYFWRFGDSGDQWHRRHARGPLALGAIQP